MIDEHTIMDTVRRNILAVMPHLDPGSISTDLSLADLGCNSLDRAEIVTLSMEQLDVVVPVTEFGNGRDIGGLVQLLRRYS